MGLIIDKEKLLHASDNIGWVDTIAPGINDNLLKIPPICSPPTSF